MIVIDIDPVIFTIGPLSVRWYGLMYVVGITVGLLAVWRYVKYKGITEAQFERFVLYSVPAGLIGARLYFVLQQPLGDYLAQPWRVFAFWQGGMAFYGAIFAVVVTIILLSRQMKIPVWSILDVSALFAVVGQFFGRIGNIINGDVLGYPTTLPWGFIYANPNSFAPRHDMAYQPAAVYEAISNLILFGILWSLRKRLAPGLLFFVYLITYSASQIVIFFWRDNEIILLGLKQAQLTAMAVILVSGIALALHLRHRNSA
jgi:phosphatidylglycerol---prolipoprotein diacylglyceryl transferase